MAIGGITEIGIGLARREEAPLIALLSRRLIERGLPWTWDEPRIVRCLRNRECLVIVARDGRRLVGFAIMEYYDEHAHLSLLAVQPAYRRRGIGRQLVEWLEATARTTGIFTVNLELRAGNDAAQAFYARLGYRAAGRRRAYYSGREDALCMTHDLAVRPVSPA